jgi:hypothetical protein
MTANLPAVPDEVFEAAVREAVSLGCRGSHDYNLMMLEGGINLDLFRAALAVAYAAGRESAYEGGEVEWSPRYPDGSPFLHGTYTEGGARRYVEESLGGSGLRLFSRRVTPWLPVEAADAGQVAT